MTFVKGKSGNPSGRTPGSGMQTRLKVAVGDKFDELVQTVLNAALQGDMTAAGLLLGRMVPQIKPVQEPTTFPLVGESLNEKAEAILTAVSDGKLSATDGKTLLDAIDRMAQIAAIPKLEERLAVLEGRR